MADGLPDPDVLEQPKGSPLDEIGDIGGGTKPTVEANAPTGTPLDEINVAPTETSAFGAAARSAGRSVIPAATGLSAAGSGAEFGAFLGSPAGPVGSAIGGVAGGLAAFYGGSKAAEIAQTWALSKLPDSFVDAFGQNERTERLDQQQHPVASFVGGLVPYAITMKPGSIIEKASLPENATAIQRLLHNPVTARLFGGGVMGGMELGSEIKDHEDLDWRKIGIATGFGLIWNKPTKVGEAITELGAAPTRRVLGRPSPTIAQAGDLKVMGPGVTEQVFQGSHEQAPTAAMTAQEAARAEHTAEPAEPDAGQIARRMEPELFARYDELVKRREAFGTWAGEGPEVSAPHEGLTAPQKHLADTNAEIEAMGPEISAAYRRAAETAGTETSEREPFPSFAAMLAAREKETGQPAVKSETTRADPALEHAADFQRIVKDISENWEENRMVGQANLFPDEIDLLRSAGFEVSEGGSMAKSTLIRMRDEAERVRKGLPKPGQREVPNEQVGAVPQVPSEQTLAPEGAVPGVQGIPAGGEAPVNVEGPAGAPAPVVPVPQRSIGDQRAHIAGDVARRLIAAGRSPEEAEAAGHLIAARYVTRAGRFEGKLGTPEELYARESASIAGPEGRPLAPAVAHQVQVAKAEASTAAAQPITPGVISSGFESATQTKNAWRDATPFKGDTDAFIAASKPNQESLAAAGKEIADGLGLAFKNPGVKADGPGKGRDRLESKAKRFGAIGSVTDQVRSGFNVETPAQADQIIQKLGEKFQITDEGWQTTPAGYFDRKAYIRFPDGMIGEVQIWPPGMFDAKESKGGHGLYEGVRELPQWHPLIPEFNRAQGELYAPVRAALSDEWKAVLGSGGNEPNVLPNLSEESTAPSRPTSAALTSSQEPLTSAQASEGVQNAGRPSQETDLMADMFGVPNENIGPHAAPVNAAIDARDKIDALSPAAQRAELPKYTAAAEQAPQGRDQPAGVFMFDPTKLEVDAKRFQFKSGGDEYGVTGALRSVQKWDPAKAQSIIVWEQADGKLFVADGHQRAGLARRLTEQGKSKDIQLPGVLYREKDGISAGDIKAIAAVTNIANGSGSALDGAKVLRARPDLMDESLPLSAGKGKQAAALARLGDEPFKMVVNDVIPEHYGAVVGDLIPHDPERQEAAIKAIARFEPKNADEAAVLTQRVAQAELAKREEGAQGSMFGDLETAESTAGEEMKIVGRAIADLKKDKTLFARVLVNAERIEQTGSSIEREAAKGITSEAEIFAKTLTSEAYTAGPIRTELIAAARDMKDGKLTAAAASARIVDALRREAEAHGADRAGAVGHQPEREFAQSDQFDFEAGAEGKPQSLIPGVAPVSARERIQALANKPMQGGNKPPPEGGLFGSSRDQQELFQIARGKIRLTTGQRPVISLLKDANPSTFIHESGHQFLEEMIRDAAHAEAPEVVKKDTETVKKWLGVGDKTFTTAKGSTYTLHEDGTTTRNKAARSDVGHEGDFGPKPRSAKTIYLETPNNAASLSAAGLQGLGPKGARVIIKDGKASLLTWNEAQNKWGISPSNRDIPFTTEPKVGRAPLEVWKPADDVPGYEAYRGMHAGNPITEMAGGEIQTKHHEKFARGFEQYMREGVAPSQGLARVFAQFRNWLLGLYQTIKGLGQEISPEIRGVFDRMLEMEPQRTVIAPERMQPDLLHDIHEAEGAHTEPHEAEATHDRVVAESNRYLADQSPEVQHEIQAAVGRVQEIEAAGVPEQQPGAGDATGKAIPSGAGAQSLVEGRGGPGAEPGGGAGSEKHGAEQPGGPVAGAEGAAGAAGPDVRSKLGDHAGTTMAPSPATLFGPEESPLVDKAGNIRIENLTNRDDVAQAIRVAAQENNEFIGDRRGVITDGQVLELADALGMDENRLNRRQLGQAFNAEQIVAARKLLVQSATHVSEAMKKAATGTDTDVMAYAQAKDRHQMIQAQVAGITAEAGRALRAFRSIAGMDEAKQIGQFVQEATGKTLFQLKAEAKLGAQLQTPQQVSKFMQDAQKRTFGRMVLEYWINGLISGPATHMTYAVGNTISTLARIPEQLVASGVGRAASALGREGPRVRAGEAFEMAKAGLRELPSAIKAGVEAVGTGVTTQLPGEHAAQGTLPFQPGSDLAQPAQFHEGATYHDAIGAAFGLVRGMRDALVSTGKLLAAGGIHGEPLVGTQYSPLGAIPDITLKGVNVLPVGSVVRAPGRLIAAIHSFYRSANFSMEKAALAYRKGVEEGLDGEALAARVAQIRSDPSEVQMNEIAAHGATGTVLMGKGSELTQALSRVTNARIFGFPLLKFIDPFVHISGNIIEQSVIQRTPAGLLTLFNPETELARDLTGKNGGAAQDKAIGRMLVGSALSVAFGSLAAEGVMSGSGPKDPKESSLWRLAGNQAHSIKIGDFWYDTHKLGPLGMLAGIAADLYDVAHEAEQGEFLKAAGHLQHAFAQNILDESFMRGPAELIQAIEDPGRYGEAYVRNFISSFVPFSVASSQITRATDPYTRQARTVTDAIKAKIPGLSETLFPRRDIWGEPMPSREVLGIPGVSAIYATRIKNDPVMAAMQQLNIFPGAVEKKIRGVELTPQEYDDFARIAGKMVKPTLDRIVKSPSWESFPPEAKHYAIQHTIESARETARNMIIGKYPHIAREAATIKQERARGEKPK